MKTYVPSPGETINDAIAEVVLMARSSGEAVSMCFNGVELEAHPKSTRRDLEDVFDAVMAERAKRVAGMERRARLTIERVLLGIGAVVTPEDREVAIRWIRGGGA